jgi:signal transduction histidine kinase
MSEVLRLIRLTLILRIAVGLLVAGVVTTLLPAPNAFLLQIAAIVPSFLLLGAAVLAPLRGWDSKRFVNCLLVAMIVAQAVESLASRWAFRLMIESAPASSGELAIEAGTDFRTLRLPLSASLLFVTIPAILGAWINGKHDALRWAAFTVLLTLLGELLIFPPEFNQFRLSVGLLGSQGIIVFIICYFVGSLADQQRAEQAQLEAANRQLAEQAPVREQLAASRERVRLSRDLHDTLAHTLAGLVVQMKAIDAVLDADPAAARRELARAGAVAKQGLDDTRAAISDLRTNAVEALGLGGALQRLVDVIGQRSGMQASFECIGPEPSLEQHTAESLFRITQEALNNVERHARAARVSVCLCNQDGTLTIQVKDDGVGFDIAALDDERFGLRGMRERAELIGAHMRVESAAGAGTQVTVTLRHSTAQLTIEEDR